MGHGAPTRALHSSISVSTSKDGERRFVSKAIPSILPTVSNSRLASDVIAMLGLSERETQFLEQVAKGLQDKEIAARFGLHPKTVSNTLSSAYRKLNVTNRRDAVRHFLGSDYPREPVPISRSAEAAHEGAAPTPFGEATGSDHRAVAKPSGWRARYRNPPRIGGTLLPIILVWTLVGSIVLTIVFGLFAVYHLASRPVAERSISSKDIS